MKYYATYNDKEVHSLRYEDKKAKEFCKGRKRIRNKYDICPFCREDVKDGPLLILFNNWKLFPNTIVHEDCCDNFKSKEEAMKYLHEDYEEALKHKHWFNLE